MVTVAPGARAFSGSATEQEHAAELFRLMQSVGRFMSVNAPIRLALDSAVEFFADKKISRDDLLAAIAANPDAFKLDESGETPAIVATRAGAFGSERSQDRSHDFATRLMTPAPKRESADGNLRPRPRMDSSWSIFDAQTTDLDARPSTSLVQSFGLTAPVEDAIAEAAEVEIEEIAEAEPARTITVPAAAAAATDVSDASDADLEAALIERLGADGQVAMFDGQWMLEDRVPRFSKGDLRKLKDYIVEQEQPLTDEVLIQDVLDVRPRSADFELMRFALNYRLSKEHRDFEFVGTSGQRFWSTSALAPIGTSLRKPNEIGTDFKYLLDDAPVTYRSRKEISHVLTFYEFTLGLLPYDSEMQELLGAPVTPNQRTAVLTFECPQVYTTYLVELRYPTPNRGGFIVGLDDFYNENLVPGALLSIRATDNDGHFIVEYVSAASQSQRLLELEERRQRYVFRPTSFACGVLDEALLTEELWSSLNGEKPLDEKTRRRPEAVVAATFERLGKQFEGGGYTASFAQLFAGVNIERPFSEALLRSILENDDTGAFAKDPDGPDDYTYIPGTPA
jgi:hypothetical protein